MTETEISIVNFHKISDTISVGGQPTTDQFKLIKDESYETVFQLIVKEAGYSVNDEAYHLRTLGLKHETMNISVAKPTEADVDQFVEIMERHKHEKLFVHCAVGYCTSGLMIIYLVRQQGMTFEQAREKVVPHWQPTPVWEELIQKFTSGQLNANR